MPLTAPGFDPVGGPVVVFPDVELMVVRYLAAAFAAPVTACTVLPRQVTDPIIRVHRIGGTPLHPKVADDARVDFDAWAGDLQSVNELGRTLRAVLASCKGWSGEGGLFVKSEEIGGLGARPETNPALFRVGLTQRLVVRPD